MSAQPGTNLSTSLAIGYGHMTEFQPMEQEGKLCGPFLGQSRYAPSLSLYLLRQDADDAEVLGVAEPRGRGIRFLNRCVEESPNDQELRLLCEWEKIYILLESLYVWGLFLRAVFPTLSNTEVGVRKAEC